MSAPLDLAPGTVVRVHGLYRARAVVMRLDREPVLVEDTLNPLHEGETLPAAVLLCGWEATNGPRGSSRRFHARFVKPDELVEVVR